MLTVIVEVAFIIGVEKSICAASFDEVVVIR